MQIHTGLVLRLRLDDALRQLLLEHVAVQLCAQRPLFFVVPRELCLLVCEQHWQQPVFPVQILEFFFFISMHLRSGRDTSMSNRDCQQQTCSSRLRRFSSNAARSAGEIVGVFFAGASYRKINIPNKINSKLNTKGVFAMKILKFKNN